MTSVIFNLNDVIILITIFQCLILGAVIALLKGIKLNQRILLTLFLFTIAADFTDTLIYWSDPIKHRLMAYSHLPFFLLKPLSFLAPPLLFLYVKSTLFSDFRLGTIHLVHGLPFIIALLSVMAFIGISSDEQLAAYVLDYVQLYETSFYHYYANVKHLTFIGYSLWAIVAVRTYYRNLQNEHSSTKHTHQEWIRLLIIGFLAIWSLYYLSYLGSSIVENDIASTTLGLSGNYFSLIFINILVAYGFTRSTRFGGVSERGHHDDHGTDPKTAAVYQKIHTSLETQQLYLDPELSLERLAQEIGEPPKATSTAINRHYRKNFFEVINHYRIEQAKALIRSHEHLSMQQVIERSGFNSKSTFNRCFKKETGLTPSDYKKTGAESQPLDAGCAGTPS